MTILQLVGFGVTLFFALVALLQWQHRRAENAARLNRGLREYLAGEGNEQSTESLSTVLLRG